MLLIRRSCLFACLLLSPVISAHVSAQIKIGNLLGKAEKTLNAAGNIKPGTAVSTSLKDSLPGITYFQDADFIRAKTVPIRSFKLKPGYYKGTVRSYCLHAGAYSPSSGEGYQLCHFRGSKAGLIQSILKRSADHPDIAQADVQTLIWGIEAGVKFTDYPLTFQAKIKPLLTPGEMASMEVNTNWIVNKLMPEPIRAMVDTYHSIQDEITSAGMKYQELEEIAVKTGIPPIGPGSKNIPKGTWSYIGQGFFLRVYPQSYPTSRIELYRPAHLSVTRDARGRITAVEREGNTASIQYDDGPGRDVYQNGTGPEVPVWRIKQITFSDRSSGQSHAVDKPGWIFRGNEEQARKTMQELQQANSGDDVSNAPSDSPKGEINYQSVFNTLDKIEKRYRQTKEFYDRWQEIVKTIDQLDNATHVRPPEDYLNETYANLQVDEALKAALNPTDFKGKSDWIAENMMMVLDLFYYAACELSGACDENNSPKEPPVADYIAQPGNSSMQRLGLSPYIKNSGG